MGIVGIGKVIPQAINLKEVDDHYTGGRLTQRRRENGKTLLLSNGEEISSHDVKHVCVCAEEQ